ncbi:hypothetical protein AAFF_G00425420 [Aldrovandia affinis]|uniref:Uncharacterized protein n=1 Tax=Aldrovandia affinis TaxID=143900 RepID=A0AAD7T763_9TELE|nr:hypothetical protein AAFF_G00425420 [Aldrovandia affinis]
MAGRFQWQVTVPPLSARLRSQSGEARRGEVSTRACGPASAKLQITRRIHSCIRPGEEQIIFQDNEFTLLGPGEQGAVTQHPL